MSAGHVIFYDGVCGLCNRFVRFVLKRDASGAFRFSALQSEFAGRALASRGANAADLDTVYVLTAEDRLLRKSRAVLFVLAQLGGLWWLLSLARVVPAFVADRVYDLVASVRYRVFGRSDACRVPDPAERARFVDAAMPDPAPAARD